MDLTFLSTVGFSVEKMAVNFMGICPEKTF